MSGPMKVAKDAAGNVYIADSNNHRIRKVDTNGVMTTVAGNGVAGVSRTGLGSAAAVDAYDDRAGRTQRAG